jgi:hypothetical protein
MDNNFENEDYITSINNYYKLKNTYETEIQTNKVKIRRRKDISNKEKFNLFNSIKPKCVNCGNAVGTIFMVVNDENNLDRRLIAKCGDKTNPCNLNINIQVGICESIIDNIKNVENLIEETKLEIIKEKNNLLFGYITSDNALIKFEELKKTISEFTSSLELLLDEYFKKKLNENKQKIIDDLKVDTYNIINDIKKQMEDFNISKKTIFTKNSINIYMNELVPKLKELMSLTYGVHRVELENNKYYLIQKTNSIADFEIFYGDVGVVDYTTKYNKMRKPSMSKKKKPKLGKKTKKNSPFKLNIIYDDENGETPTSETKSKEEEEDYSKMYI